MPATRTAITIGTFDGVHLGHLALVSQARACVDVEGMRGRVVVLAFEPSPADVFRKQQGMQGPPRLTTFEQRVQLLKAAGVDEVVRLEPTPQLLSQTPDQFVEQVASQWKMAAVVEGPDFRFGKARSGDVKTLASLGQVHGFEVKIVSPVEVAMTNHTHAPARSTMVRWLLGNGRVRDAACLLGRPYELSGTVTQGDRRGRTIGYPTANFVPQTMLPADGVYAGVATLPDGSRVSAAINVGARPTFNGVERRVEGHLLDTENNSDANSPFQRLKDLDEYGWTLKLELIGWIRDQMRFAGVDQLIEQLGRDCRQVRQSIDRTISPPQGQQGAVA